MAECFLQREEENSGARSEDVILELKLTDIDINVMSLAICRSFKYMADKTRVISQPLLARLGYDDQVNP